MNYINKPVENLVRLHNARKTLDFNDYIQKIEQNELNKEKVKLYSNSNSTINNVHNINHINRTNLNKIKNNKLDLKYKSDVIDNISYKRVRNLCSNLNKTQTNLTLTQANDYLTRINNIIQSGSSIPYLVCASYLMSSTLVFKLLYAEVNDNIDS